MAFRHSQENQLLFNLDAAPASGVNGVKFHRPEAIVIEKCGPSTTPPRPSPAFQFSSVSEQQLSAAIQLAKRDLRKQKQEDQLERSQVQRPKGMTLKKGKAKIVHSQDYKNRLKRRQERDKGQKVVHVKEREKAKSARSASVQTQRQQQETTPQKQPVLHVRQDLGYLPATSHSPPTRDTDDPCQRNTVQTQDDRSMQEIRKLRDDINNCLVQIREAENRAKQDHAGGLTQKPSMYAEDIEEARKKAMRSEEHTTRLSRTLFTLNQQVKEIQDDLGRLVEGTVPPKKKTQLLTRLAAAHRGTLRALQSLVQHLPDFQLHNGMPRTYHDMIFLVRQLSLCCAQLEVAGETGVPPSVLNLLRDVGEFNDTLERELRSSPHRSPPRPCRTGKVNERSPASRQLFSEEVAHPGGQKQRQQPKHQPAFSHDVRPGKDTVERLQKNTQDKAVDASPERNAALRAGISALLRAGEAPPSPRGRRRPGKPPGVPPLNLPATPRTPRARSARDTPRAWDVPLDNYQQQARKKGILLPSQLQRQRPPTRAPMGGGYAEPTLSSRMKEVDPDDWPQPTSPRTPRQRQGQSPRGRRARSLSPPPTPLSVARQEIERQVWFDRDAVNRMKEIEAIERAERQSTNRARRQLDPLDQWDLDAELKMQTKIHPLLEKAEELTAALNRASRELTTTRNQSAGTNTELNADMLADLVLDDIVGETAQELQYLEEDDRAHDEALDMQNAPDLETIMQRIRQMEDEQDEIRRRYATIIYEDDFSERTQHTAYIDAPYSEQPMTPPPIEVTSTALGHQGRDLSHDLHLRGRSHSSQADAIVFTKPVAQSQRSETLHLSQPPATHASHQVAAPEQRVPRIPLYMTRQMTDNIHRNQQQFEAYLKKACHASVGLFNPWQIVQEISDEILAECVQDVGKELEDINNDIINHVYQSEFTQAPADRATPPGESEEKHIVGAANPDDGN